MDQPSGMDEHGPGRSPIVHFDADCALCSRWVQFILDRDPDGEFRFAALGSDTSARAIGDHPPIQPDTVAVLAPEGILTQSDAVLYVLGRLRGFAWIARALCWIPRPIRDRAYNLVARYRRRLLPGSGGVCSLGTGPRDRHL